MGTLQIDRWDQLQHEALERLFKLFINGPGISVVTAPTGFGKTKMSVMALKSICDVYGEPWIFYTHRKMLFSQTLRKFQEEGLDPGCRASGWEELEDVSKLGQIAMIPSEASALQNLRRERHKAKLVIIDEAHDNKTGFAAQLAREHAEEGAKVWLFTATPVGLESLAKELLVLATVKQARECGALLPAKIFNPSIVDIGSLKPPSKEAEFSRRKLGKKFMNTAVIGDIYDHWRELNPNRLPTILFAPSVESSKWMVDELIGKGVKAAHIDGSHIYYGDKDETGENVYIDSKPQANRDELARRSKTREIEIVCNRFVLREGVDWPWIYHGIIATRFNTITAWIQVCGRILRNHPDYDHVLITDHGGSVIELGSPNKGIDWKLEDTNESVKERVAGDKQKKPVCCKKCKALTAYEVWKKNGNKCSNCGAEFKKSSKTVIQEDGTLVEYHEDPDEVPKAKIEKPSIQKEWDRLYYASKNSKSNRASTFNQMKFRFSQENPGWYIGSQGNVTVARNSSTGEAVRLIGIPAPDSSYWSWKVNQTPFNKLQGNLE